MNIGFYNRVSHLKRDSEIPIELFIQSIINGKWKNDAIGIRKIEDKQERKFAKEKIGSVTVSGIFNSRLDKEILIASGYIGMDIDDLKNPQEDKERLQRDPFVYSIFITVGGHGLCAIFKTNPKKSHRDQFFSISKYLFETYNIVVDPSGINESRNRYVSWDPDAYHNTQCRTFDLKYEKPKTEKIQDIVFSKNDFDRLINQIETQGLNLCESYHEWLRIGFSFVHQFKEDGRGYFHQVSKQSPKYSKRTTDLQYEACLKAEGSNTTTISTFYYYCKQAGLQIYDASTKIISHSMRHGKKSGLSKEQVAKNLEKFENITLTPDEVNAFFNSNSKITEDDILNELKIWIRQNYDLKRNSISRYIESDNIALQQVDYNSIFIEAKTVIPTVNYELIDRLINSNFIMTYNPLKKFLEDRENDIRSEGHIEKLFLSIKTDRPDVLLKFGKKWLVSIIASIYGEHSPLMLVLCGPKQGTGKTEFFRRLLPKELHKYYAESKLDAGKDDEILMTKMILIMDDEMGGKNKKEDKRLKELLSKQTFTLREPYGRHTVDLERIAVLCGTTNDEEILFDTTGNRRILPFFVYDIDHAIYNLVDKEALFMELYWLYKEGFDWKLSFDDVLELSGASTKFNATSLESELIDKYFISGLEPWTSTDIKIHIEKHSMQKIYIDRLCKELKRKGFEQQLLRPDGVQRRCYMIKEITKDPKNEASNRF
ncbi:MAG: PriCT-2 domain-containing protein [Gloeobacteraceae cyanobacterium ES-bin-316]|nr:PriCT-2 domain-containing protein [Ferruginibacter sp.]